MSVTRAARTRYSTPTGPTSQGPATMSSIGFERGDTGARGPSPATDDGGPPRRARGCGRPVLHSGRLPLIYGIASAATCAPSVAGPRTPQLVHATNVRRSSLGEGAEPAGEGQRVGVRGPALRADHGATTGDVEEID